MSLSEFVKKTSEMQDKCYGPKSNVSFNAKLIQIELPLVVLRHSKECRGQIKHGVCRQCHKEVNEIDGDLSFHMAFELQDLEDKKIFHSMIGYGAAAKSIFGSNATPESVRDMEKKDVYDVLESWMEVAINVQAVIEFDTKRGMCRVSPYDISKLSLNYMPEYK